MNLITAKEVKLLTSIENNVSDDTIFPLIEIAQEAHIKPILGETLYNKMIINPNAYPDLYEKLKKPLAFWVFWEYLPFSYIKITNKGLVKRTSDHSETLAADEFRMMRNEVREFAKMLTNSLIQYLEKSNISAYKKQIEGGTVQKNNSNVSGIYFY